MSIFLAFFLTYSIALVISLIDKNKHLKEILDFRSKRTWELELENAFLRSELKEKKDYITGAKEHEREGLK